MHILFGGPMTNKLHIFRFSTYCEKAIWALDLAELDSEFVFHMPGPHAGKIKKMAPQTSVPVLEVGDQVVAGSDRIADFAHHQRPELELIPPDLRDDILAWQMRLDDIGHVLRATLFYDLLKTPGRMADILTAGLTEGRMTGYGLVFRCMAPMLRRMIQREHPDKAKAWAACREVFDAVAEEAGGTGYLVGDRFTLADLTAASIFYPVVLDDRALGAKYAREQPEMQAWQAEWADHPGRAYVERIYRDHR